MQGLGLAAPRPRYSVLGSERGMLLPPLEKALTQYIDECELLRVEIPRRVQLKVA